MMTAFVSQVEKCKASNVLLPYLLTRDLKRIRCHYEHAVNSSLYALRRLLPPQGS